MSKLILHNCSGCRQFYPLGAETTLFLYIRQPIINHLVTKCPVCQTIQTYWVLDEDLINRLVTEVARARDITLKVGTYAADRTWQKFCAATGRRYSSRPRFTAQEAKDVENEVGFFRHLLETGKVPW